MPLPRIAGIIFVIVGLIFVYLGLQPPRDNTRLVIGLAFVVLGALRIVRSRATGSGPGPQR
jgi:membrane-bound ClpP family serine protease